MFCSQCGSPCAERVPDGDDRPRSVCGGCGTIHYQNPRIVVGAMVLHEGALLICRRAIRPREGFWTCPGGFMECEESMAQTEARETWEEACASVAVKDLYAMYNLPHKWGQTPFMS